MPVLDEWELNLSVDQVLRAQGADPEEIRSRRPILVRAAEKAIDLGRYLLKPKVLFEKYPVKGFIHERIELDNVDPGQHKSHLSGPLISQHLSKAREIILMICTIGNELDTTVARLFNQDPVVALALDGVGSAAVESLAIQACNHFEIIAKRDGLYTSMPLNPGMVGWPVDVGQPQIFSLLDSDEIQVSITESCMMVPNKSLSIALGIGNDFSSSTSTCEYCSLKGVCRYRDHYAE